MKFLSLNWQDIEILCSKLSEKIINKNFNPDLIIGISRGGLVPTRLLSDLLNIKNVATIRLEIYKKKNNKNKKPKLLQPLAINIKNKKVLVVDDVSDSGTSLKFIKKYLKEKKPHEIKFATLHLKPNATFIPDFYVTKTSSWIIYPWEKKEVARELKA
ncbi:MAG: phosphoribosyltransferase [Candidatus Anstonellaceae archaeon]